MNDGAPVLRTNDLKRHVASIEVEVQWAISNVVSSGWFVLGPEVEAFEREFAAYCGVAHCVTVANGTDALEMALRAAGIGTGSKVATVANAGMYSTLAILAVGATPVYVDICADTLLMSADELASLLDDQEVDAIIVTHLYGLMADMPGILSLARRRGATVIEDCAQAHGAQLGGKKAGSFGDLACFSFYPTKNLGALGDGGAVVTDRADWAEGVRLLRQYGWDARYHTRVRGGRNSRLDALQAAVLRVKLPRLDGWNARRRAIATAYTTRIRNPRVVCPEVYGQEYTAHLYVVRTQDRDALVRHLAAAGVVSDIHYPLADYQQDILRNELMGVQKPATESACAQVLTLPCFPEMTDHEVSYVIECVSSFA